ncbi:MAG: hypothetical protein QOH71_4214 [Blastocatellia bacterium]|jgi:hypothetical protein|nr:hypothetical protein [Blastocatellia bacterium]
MLLKLQDAATVQSAKRSIDELLGLHTEWFLTQDGAAPFPIGSAEFDFSVDHQRLIFSGWLETGFRSWRITAWNWSGQKLSLEARRRMGAEVATLELVPRESARAIVAGITAARQARCVRLAQIAVEALVAQTSVCDSSFEDHTLKSGPLKIESATLSPGMRRDQPGRYARVILRRPNERIAVTAIVAGSDARNIDSLFSSALLWFTRLQQRPKQPLVEKLLIAVEKNILEAARQRHVLLRESLRQRIELWQIHGSDPKIIEGSTTLNAERSAPELVRGGSPTVRESVRLTTDGGWQYIEPVRAWERKNLWRQRLKQFRATDAHETIERVEQIVSLAPQAVDVVAARHGQTLRYHGLPFARVRRVMDRDRIWFGIEGSRRRLLDDYHEPDWQKLWRDLEDYREANCLDRRHWFYRAAGEAWLESILRRDISKLDPGLIIAPLHAQFRTSHGGPTSARPIDLLALRHDGRLAVIELKVNEDREHVFQGVDYWRRVEAHRRRGHISTAKLFGDREISDESPLVYLVAPTLRFHPSFATLARTIAPDIEVYRFDINEDWRTGVRVVRRERVNA